MEWLLQGEEHVLIKKSLGPSFSGLASATLATNIPQNFRHLVAVFAQRVVAATNTFSYMFLNGQEWSGYKGMYQRHGQGHSSNTDGTGIVMTVPSAYQQANNHYVNWVYLPWYNLPGYDRTFMTRCTMQVECYQGMGWYLSTDPITSMSVVVGASTWTTATYFELWGIK